MKTLLEVADRNTHAQLSFAYDPDTRCYMGHASGSVTPQLAARFGQSWEAKLKPFGAAPALIDCRLLLELPALSLADWVNHVLPPLARNGLKTWMLILPDRPLATQIFQDLALVASTTAGFQLNLTNRVEVAANFLRHPEEYGYVPEVAEAVPGASRAALA